VQTLDQVLSIASRPGHCPNPECTGHTRRLLSAQGQGIAPASSTYGYDVVTRIGWLRQHRFAKGRVARRGYPLRAPPDPDVPD
jgi:hypothetical protein